MPTLSIDIETYSSINLGKAGVYHYVEALDFEILLFAYKIDDEPVCVIDLANNEEIPEEVKAALVDPKVEKKAFNANFERVCISKHFGILLPAEQWTCTMVKASMLGLPLALEVVAKVLKLPEQKQAAGKALIRYFSVPCKPTKANGMRTRNLPAHAPEKWAEFKSYCVQDVVVEDTISQKIAFFQIPAQEKKLWALDQKINDTGVLMDHSFITNAISIDGNYRERLTEEAITLTGLSNPNSAAQLKNWIGAELGEDVEKLTKDAVPELLKGTDSDTVKRVLNIRQEMAKTSVKKYIAMTNSICNDLRVRGLVQFYGANRTGRWAGRLIQVQNLPRIQLKDLDFARQLVVNADGELLEMVYGNVSDVLSQLIRTSFIAPEGHRLLVADFSAIEARVIAWLAGENWRLEVFRTHGKIYEASASQMFKVPIDKITKGSPLRQRGKVAELALGYQGGPNALIKMGALKEGLTEEELPKLVAMWRNANKAIVNLWDVVGNAAIEAVETGQAVFIKRNIRFHVEKGVLFITLPSGRKLAYLRPKLVPSKFGGVALTYEGMNQVTKQWGKQDTYGGKLVENIVQAIARDCLADSMIRIDDAGYKIGLHVHDEVLAEMPDGVGSIEEMLDIMRQPVPWAPGLPLDADGFETMYYKKD